MSNQPNERVSAFLIIVIVLLILMISMVPAVGSRVPQAGTDNFVTIVNGNTGTPWIAVIVSEQSPGGMGRNPR